MALTNLGINTVNIEDDWVSFNPIELDSKDNYLVQVQIDSASPEFIYSQFVFRFKFPTVDTLEIVSEEIGRLYYDPLPQFLYLPLTDALAKKEDCIVQVRRFAYFSRPSELSEATVTVSINPDAGFRP